MRRFFKIFYLFLFCFILSAPLLLNVFEIQEKKQSTENRKLKELPTFDINHLDPFPSKFEAFYNDHFPFRNTMLSDLSYVYSRYFLKSPMPEKVVLGVDDWMYALNSDFNYYTGKEKFSNGLTDSILQELKRRSDTCNRLGVEYRIIVVPSKPKLYPENLPSYFFKSENDPVSSLLDMIREKTKIPVLYLEDSLKKYKKSGKLYMKLDTHWSDLGTYYGYCGIINWLKIDHPRLKPVSIDNFYLRDTLIKSGNICNQLGLDEFYSEEKTLFKEKIRLSWRERKKENYPVWSWFGYPWEYEKAYQNIDSTLPGLLIIRDSFTNELLQQLMASHYGRTTVIWDYWQHKLNYNIIRNERPRFVIDIINELFLKNYAAYPEKYLTRIDSSGL